MTARPHPQIAAKQDSKLMTARRVMLPVTRSISAFVIFVPL